MAKKKSQITAGKRAGTVEKTGTAAPDACEPRGLGAAGRVAFQRLIAAIEAGPVVPDKPDARDSEHEWAEYGHLCDEALDGYRGLVAAAGAWIRRDGANAVVEEIERMACETGSQWVESARVRLPRQLRKLESRWSKQNAQACESDLPTEDRDALVNAFEQLERRIAALEDQWDLPDDVLDGAWRQSAGLDKVRKLVADIGCTEIEALLNDAEIDTGKGRALVHWFILPRCRDLIGVGGATNSGEERQRSDMRTAPGDDGEADSGCSSNLLEIAPTFDVIKWKGHTFELGRSMKKRLVLKYLLEQKRDMETAGKQYDFNWKLERGKYNEKNPSHEIDSEDLRNQVFKKHTGMFDVLFEHVDPRAQKWRLLLPVPPNFKFEMFC